MSNNTKLRIFMLLEIVLVSSNIKLRMQKWDSNIEG